MRTRTAIIVGGLLLGVAGPSGPVDASQGLLPLEELVVRVQERYRSIDDLRARFHQRKVPRPGLPGTVVEGAWYVRTPGRLRVEYDEPPRVFVADGETIYWYLPEDNQVQVVEQGGSEPRYTPTLYLAGGADLIEDFRVSGVEWKEPLEPGNVQVRLDPVGDGARFSHLVMEIDPDRALVVRLVSFGLLGDTSEFEFHEIETDVGLRDELFRFTIPAGAAVEHLGR